VKVSKHALSRAIERQGVPGRKRKRREKVNAAVREAMTNGVVCRVGVVPWIAQVVHQDGRRWIVNLRTQKVITSLPAIRVDGSRLPGERR
jgi:hypothetical protein